MSWRSMLQRGVLRGSPVCRSAESLRAMFWGLRPWRVGEPRRRSQREHATLSLGLAALELAEPDGHVPSKDVRAGVGFDHDYLMPVRVPGRRQQADPWEHIRLAFVLDIRRAVEVDPLPERVVVDRTRVGELACLDVDRHAREEAVPAAVVEVQVGVDDADDVARDVLGVRRRAHIVDLGPRLDQAGVDQHAAHGVVDCPDVYGHLLAFYDEITARWALIGITASFPGNSLIDTLLGRRVTLSAEAL